MWLPPSYWALEGAAVEEAASIDGAGMLAASMITVRVEVDVRPALSQSAMR